MHRKREVDNLSTIFDLKIGKALSLPRSVSARVMFTYDKNKMKKEFKILDNKMNADISHLFIKCLKLLFPECDIVSMDQEFIKECDQGKIAESS